MAVEEAPVALAIYICVAISKGISEWQGGLTHGNAE